MFGMGPQELLIVGVVAILIFGKKLPEVARSLGASYREFRSGLQEIQNQFHRMDYDTPSYKTPEPKREDDEAPTAPKFEPPSAPPVDVSPTPEESNTAR